MNDSDTVLTVRQLQDLLRVDRITIYRMLSDGRLRGFKVGGQWRFSRQAIEAWLRQQQANLAAVAQPATSMAGQPLSPPSDALPLSCLEAIQDILAQALGIAVVTTAPDGTPLTAVANSCRFCTLILDTEAGRQRCNGSWRAAAAQHRPASGRHPGPGPQLATCHAGLSYACDHVEVGGRLVAVVLSGQQAHYLLKLIAERSNRRLIGIQGVGPGDVMKRIDVAITAMTARMTVDEVANLDLAYAPPYSEAMDVLIHGANVLRNKLDGLLRGVTATELQASRQAGEDLMLLDVRSPDEHQDAAIPGSTLIPLGAVRSRLAEIPRDKRVVAYCKTSLRAWEAISILSGQGYDNVEILDGGFLAWPFETHHGA